MWRVEKVCAVQDLSFLKHLKWLPFETVRSISAINKLEKNFRLNISVKSKPRKSLPSVWLRLRATHTHESALKIEILLRDF